MTDEYEPLAGSSQQRAGRGSDDAMTSEKFRESERQTTASSLYSSPQIRMDAAGQGAQKDNSYFSIKNNDEVVYNENFPALGNGFSSSITKRTVTWGASGRTPDHIFRAAPAPRPSHSIYSANPVYDMTSTSMTAGTASLGSSSIAAVPPSDDVVMPGYRAEKAYHDEYQPEKVMQEKPIQKAPSSAPRSNPPPKFSESDFPAMTAGIPLTVPSYPKSTTTSSQMSRKDAPSVVDLPVSCQAKKPGDRAVSLIINQIKNNTKTNIEMSTSSATGTQTFIISGKPADITRARREILGALSIKKTLKISVPESCIGHIIGTRGKVLQNIQNQSITKITIPKDDVSGRDASRPDDASEASDNESDRHVIVSIHGDEEGCRFAASEIQNIVAERTLTSSLVISNIPSIYFQFLAGPRNANIAELQNQYNVRIKIPLYQSSGDLLEDQKKTENIIIISGETEGVKKVASILQKHADNLKIILRDLSISLPKRQHRLIIGTKNSGLQEIMETTGCTIEFAPLHDPSEKVVIRGPADKLALALEKVMEKASSMSVAVVSLENYDAEHARRLIRYLLASGRLRKVETQHAGLQIFPPRRGATDAPIELVCRDSNVLTDALGAVQELVDSTPPSHIITTQVPAAYRPRLVGKGGENIKQIKETHGVDIIMSPKEEEEDDHVLLVWCGAAGAEAKKTKAKDIEAQLQIVNELIKKIIRDAGDFVVQTIKVSQDLHRNLIGHKRSVLNSVLQTFSQGDEGPTVTVIFGSTAGGEPGKSSARGNMSPDDILLRGPKTDVEKVASELKRLAEEARQAKVLTSYAVELRISSQFVARVIGKGGSNVQKIKDDLNVIVDINDAQDKADAGNSSNATAGSVLVKLKGEKKNVEEAKKRILEMTEKMASEVTEKMKIPGHVYKSVVGQAAKNIRRLEERYSVRIHLPRKGKADDAGGASTEVAPEETEITIVGDKKAVQSTRDEIKELVEYEKEHSNVEEFKVPAMYLRYIVGKFGRTVEKIKNDSDTRIDVGTRKMSDGDAAAKDEQVDIRIQGTLKGVRKARHDIETLIAQFTNQVTLTVDIDQAAHRLLIGQSGSRIRETVLECEKRVNAGKHTQGMSAGNIGRVVKFPPASAKSNTVTLTGDRALLEAICEELVRQVDEHHHTESGASHGI